MKIVNVMITRRNDVAVKCAKVGGATKSFTASGVFESALECLIDTLEVIPTEVCDNTYHIYLPDSLIGFSTGSICNYIKTGCTNSNNKLTARELELFKKALVMYGERIVNVSLRAIKTMNKKDSSLVQLKEYCIKALNEAIANNNTVQSQPTQVVDPNAVIRQQLSEQMLALVTEGKFVEAQAISQMIANLSATPVSSPAPTVNEVVETNSPAEEEIEDLDIKLQREMLNLNGESVESDFELIDTEAEGIKF